VINHGKSVMKRGCEKVSRLVSERFERKLTVRERFNLIIHFAMCAACKHYSQNMIKLHKVLSMKQDSRDFKLPERKKAEISNTLQKLKKD